MRISDWSSDVCSSDLATALLGEKAAMACTVAVEEVIDEHYAGQHSALEDDPAALKDTIEGFRQEELQHRDIGLAQGAEEAPGRSEERRVAKECCRTCRFRWAE